MLTKKEVMIHIRTLRRGVAVPLFGGDTEDCDEELDIEEVDQLPNWEGSESDEPEEAEMMMEGRFVTTSLRAELMYEESELTGMEGSTTKIGFDRKLPQLVSMLRSGSVNTALIFEPNARHICVYNTPFSSFEVCVHTLEIQNRLLEDGSLYIDYLIEIHGARTERCKMYLSMR